MQIQHPQAIQDTSNTSIPPIPHHGICEQFRLVFFSLAHTHTHTHYPAAKRKEES